MDAARGILLAANWKCNHHWEQCEAYARQLSELLPPYFEEEPSDGTGRPDLLLCPPLPYVAVLGSLLDESSVLLGAQDVSRGSEGAHTGEVSAAMLSDIGCDYCIVGHSERRAAGEDDEAIALKLRRLAEAEITPILCVGEPLEIRDGGMAQPFVTGQLDALRETLLQFSADSLVIAYEPIWAIGTGRNAEPADAQAMAAEVRSWLAGLGGEYAEQVPVLYGGSVNPQNLANYLKQPDIDGALVGGASLQAEGMTEMVNAASNLPATPS